LIFIDRSIPKSVASALKLVRSDVLWLEDRFPHDAKEQDWLSVAGESEWLVIMRDKKVRTRRGERQAIVDNRVGCFIINQGNDPTRWEYLRLLALTLDEMERRFDTTARPFIYTISREGKFNQVLRP
jgi:hypothetical protein